MTRSRIIWLGIGGLVAWFVLHQVHCFLGCAENHRWNQKLTLVIDTPAGEVTGSSVIEVRASFYENGMAFTNTELTRSLTGEATVVEVLPGRYLFALLGGNEGLIFDVAKDHFTGSDRGAWLRAIPDLTGPVAIPTDELPLLVTFDDITDPLTVRQVTPADLDSVFGPGVSLAAATLEVTDEPMMTGRVEEVLKWLKDTGGGMLDGANSSSIAAENRLANDLTLWDFRRP
jgi:hypothetical protein